MGPESKVIMDPFWANLSRRTRVTKSAPGQAHLAENGEVLLAWLDARKDPLPRGPEGTLLWAP